MYIYKYMYRVYTNILAINSPQLLLITLRTTNIPGIRSSTHRQPRIYTHAKEFHNCCQIKKTTHHPCFESYYDNNVTSNQYKKVEDISTAKSLYAHWVPQLSDFVPKTKHAWWGHIKPVHKNRSTCDGSIPRSLQRWVSTKSSISQLTGGFYIFLWYYSSEASF